MIDLSSKKPKVYDIISPEKAYYNDMMDLEK